MSELPLSELRQQVADRAEHRCEYCLMKEADSFLTFHLDHIISRKHGGEDTLDNLAYACPHCNQHKGTDLATIIEHTDDLVRLFHPRKDSWEDHFSVEGGEIIGETRIGTGTSKLLQFNEYNRLLLRNLLAEAGRYP